MEKKVLLKDLVSTGTHIRTDVTPKAVISDNGEHQIAEFWDANKTIDVIVNNSHKQHDNIRELDEYTHAEESRAKAAEANLNRIKVGRITVEDVKTLTENLINSLSTGDVVIKSKDGKSHAYTVTYKKADEMCLVYADHENIEEVYYEKLSNIWTYVQTDNVPLKFKTISGQSIIGEGNINIQSVVTANESMPDDWLTATTMSQLITKINNDPNAIKGKIYLSTLQLDDLPTGLSQAEVKVEIMGQQAGEKILLFSITSANVAPYKWEYTSYNEQHGPWRSWLISTTEIPTIPTNVSSFTNDAGYLTSHQSLSNYYTKSEVEGLIAAAIASLTPSEQLPSEPSEPSEPSLEPGQE